MADGPPLWRPGASPVLDYQGQQDERTWVMREKVLEDETARLRQEVEFLRKLALSLASSTDRERP